MSAKQSRDILQTTYKPVVEEKVEIITSLKLVITEVMRLQDSSAAGQSTG